MKRNIQNWRVRIIEFLTPKPEIKEDYVDKVIILLQNDFNVADQNDIVLSILDKLIISRDQEIIDKTEELIYLKEYSKKLKEKIK